MDRFSYIILLENLKLNKQSITLEYFNKVLLTLSKEDIDEIFNALTSTPAKDESEGTYVLKLLGTLWPYR